MELVRILNEHLTKEQVRLITESPTRCLFIAASEGGFSLDFISNTRCLL